MVYTYTMSRRIFLTLTVIALYSAGCVPAISVRPALDAGVYPEPPLNAITFWGHATSYIDVGGYGIVTDPVFAGAYSPFHRRTIPAPPEQAYDQTRLILISHAHLDHLHPKTLDRFTDGTVVLCPEPSVSHVDDLGLVVRPMLPGDTYEFPGGKITAVPAHHPGGRLSLKARHDGRALGYVIETEESTIYYSGDTEYYAGLAEIGRQFEPDVAIININGHLNSSDAMLAIAALGTPKVIPSHFGAYAGSNARHSSEWRAELMAEMRQMIIPLDVGDSYFLPVPDRGVVASGTVAETPTLQ
jgi:L-ascorbate metabolism protein UlaG (beta-lactamase superfamily)